MSLMVTDQLTTCKEVDCVNTVNHNVNTGKTYSHCLDCWNRIRKCPKCDSGNRTLVPSSGELNVLCKRCWESDKYPCPNFKTCNGVRNRKSGFNKYRHKFCFNCWKNSQTKNE